MVVIRCKFCNQAMTVPNNYKKIKVTCPNSECRKQFVFDYKDYKRKKMIKNNTPYFFLFLLISLIVANWLRINNNITQLKTDFDISNNQTMTFEENKLKNELIEINEKHKNEIALINKKSLRNEANKHYNKIWKDRSNFEQKYAITSREKILLEMKNVASNKNSSIDEIIKKIAKVASPNNSEIKIIRRKGGRILEINFDMSELTSGEVGSSTKHKTIESLKKETIRLISQVSNDVYEFCYDIDLTSIHIGLRHIVRQYIGNQFQGEENQIIYKIRIDKNKLSKLKNNPFLDFYSTTKNLTVIKNEFPNLNIEFENNYDFRN